ncbi:transketolase [Candidatus Kaiserbacteria bacterium]|nr:transketolase [Candidatus Kaiserbacteria bacterium]
MASRTPKDIQKIGAEIRRLVVEMSYRSRSGETGSSLSISDLLAVLYFKTLRINPKKPSDPGRDRFILSKGHGAAALYATLALRGFFPQKTLLDHRVNGGVFHAHPSKGAAPGIEVSTGALGHGLSIGVGMAYALKDTKSKVYVLIGDGECNEGSIWEAVLAAGALRLSNIVAIVDENKFQGFGASEENNPFDAVKQWSSFGWDALRVDGHDTAAIEKALAEATGAAKPFVIIADTVSGKGVPAIENTLGAHYYVPDAQAVAAMKL